MAFSDEKYILFTTFRRDGTPVSTPVWLVKIDDSTFGFWTSSGSGKAKRLAHTAKAALQPCNARGVVKTGTEPIEATARLVVGTEFDQIKVNVVAKYGAMTKLTKLLGTIGGTAKGKRIPYGDRGVLITLAS